MICRLRFVIQYTFALLFGRPVVHSPTTAHYNESECRFLYTCHGPGNVFRLSRMKTFMGGYRTVSTGLGEVAVPVRLI